MDKYPIVSSLIPAGKIREAYININNVSRSVEEMNISSNDSIQKAEETGRIAGDTVKSS
ncbi:MAG: hypothetical protein KAR20_16610 [Candidatus Heimdallarchaeota archaeon]|nr:hypothetical protein [Candidatus Heimdallarchaeota archaeon]